MFIRIFCPIVFVNVEIMGFPDFGLEIEIGGYKKIEYSLKVALGLTWAWIVALRISEIALHQVYYYCKVDYVYQLLNFGSSYKP